MSTRPNQAPSALRRSTQPIDAPQLLEGRVLNGRYRLERVLNTGGMGIVYEATQLAIGRKVAVKILKPTLSADPSLVERFHLEVQIAASISHPNVVQLFDSGTGAGGVTYLVMEFVEGKSLRQALRSGDLKLWEILYVFSQVCAALVETHGQQVIHRDLKFDNIMVLRMRDGRIHAKLLDFGVAKLLSSDLNLTKGGQITGTPGIIAPELVDGERPSPRSDLYSLGVLMFTAFTGRAPFEAENDLELMRAHKTRPLPNLRRLVGDKVPEEVVDLTAELLEKDPDRRPARAADVRRRLDRMAHTLRERFPDATNYVPPQDSGLLDQESTGEVEILLNQQSAGDKKVEMRGGLIGFLFPRPVVAPMTVVAYLSLILMLLIMMLVYLIYQQWFLTSAG